MNVSEINEGEYIHHVKSGVDYLYVGVVKGKLNGEWVDLHFYVNPTTLQRFCRLANDFSGFEIPAKGQYEVLQAMENTRKLPIKLVTAIAVTIVVMLQIVLSLVIMAYGSGISWGLVAASSLLVILVASMWKDTFKYKAENGHW